MSKFEAFKGLLSSLEEKTCSKHILDSIGSDLERNQIFASMFETHLMQRFRENIEFEILLNLINHLERSEYTQHLSELVNKKIAADIVWGKKNFDYLIYLCQHDTRPPERYVLNELIKQLGLIRINEALDIVNIITPHIGIDKYTLLLKILEEGKGYINGFVIILNRLDVETQYLVLISAIETGSKIFRNLIDSIDVPLKVCISQEIAKFKDESDFAKAIRNSKFSASVFDSTNFNLFIEAYKEELPLTLDCLYKKAEAEGLWNYLFLLSHNKSRKELLKSLVKSHDNKIIDHFFLLYRNDPEVKHLAPFI